MLIDLYHHKWTMFFLKNFNYAYISLYKFVNNRAPMNRSSTKCMYQSNNKKKIFNIGLQI